MPCIIDSKLATGSRKAPDVVVTRWPYRRICTNRTCMWAHAQLSTDLILKYRGQDLVNFRVELKQMDGVPVWPRSDGVALAIFEDEEATLARKAVRRVPKCCGLSDPAIYQH